MYKIIQIFWKYDFLTTPSRFDLVCGRSGVPVVAKMIFFSGASEMYKYSLVECESVCVMVIRNYWIAYFHQDLRLVLLWQASYQTCLGGKGFLTSLVTDVLKIVASQFKLVIMQMQWQGTQTSYLSFFSPQMYFWAQFFSTWKDVKFAYKATFSTSYTWY